MYFVSLDLSASPQFGPFAFDLRIADVFNKNPTVLFDGLLTYL